MTLTPKRKILTKSNSDSLDALSTTITNEIVNEVDRRNLGYFDFRLRIPVGENKYDS